MDDSHPSDFRYIFELDYTYIVSYLKQSTFISFSRSLQGSPDLGPCYKILVFEGLVLALLIIPSHHPI